MVFQGGDDGRGYRNICKIAGGPQPILSHCYGYDTNAHLGSTRDLWPMIHLDPYRYRTVLLAIIVCVYLCIIYVCMCLCQSP